MTGVYCAVVLVPGLLWLFRRFPLSKNVLLRYLPLYAIGIVVFGVLHTTLMTLTRTLLYPLFGVGVYDPGFLSYVYLMEFHKQILVFWFVFAIVEFFKRHEENRCGSCRGAQPL